MTPGTKTRWRRDIAINLILVLAAVVVPLVALELYLAWDNRRPTVPLTTVELDGQKYPFEESADALSDLHNKAVIVGDSFTAGAACCLAGSYPGRLDRLLAQHGETYRVLNLGVPGSDPFMYLRLIEGLLHSGRVPSLVVVTLFSNDIELTCSSCQYLGRIRRDSSFTPDEITRLTSFCGNCWRANDTPTAHYSVIRRIHTWLVDKSYAYVLLRDGLVGLSMKLGFNVGWGRTAYPPQWRSHQGIEFKMLRFALAGIRDALKARGVSRMMVVIYPDMENVRRENEYVGIYGDAEAELSRALGVPVWSGYPAFLDSPESKPNMSYSLVDHHPSCKAHELFAKGVYLRMQQAGYVTPPSAAHP